MRQLRAARGRVGSTVVIAFAIAVVAGAVGAASVGNGIVAVVLAVLVLVIGLAASDPLLVIALAVAATLLMTRVGGALSISDVALGGATLVSLFLLRGAGLRSMAPVLWAGVAYLAAILPTTVLNPYVANIVEWAHDVFLVLGSLILGFVIARYGRVRLAVGLYVLGCAGIGVAALITGLLMLVTEGRFGPVYLPTLDKNLIGCALAAAILILYGRPAWFQVGARWRWVLIAACAGGVAAAGSRQAMVGLAVGLLVVGLRRHPQTGKYPKLPWITALLILYGVWGLVNDQLHSSNVYNSANQRLSWYGESFQIWLKSPIFGVGLRWWYTGRFGVNFQPPNLEFEQLTTVGVVGLLALLALFVVAFVMLWRLDPWYGTVGAAVVVARFTESQFDLYWVAGQSSFLWIITGICVGAVVRDRVMKAEAQGTARLAPPVRLLRPARAGLAAR